MSDVLIAKESFQTTIKGNLYAVVKGKTRVAADHPLVKQNPEYFEAPDNEVTYPSIEQATKAPGEKRGSKAAKKDE